MNWSAIIIGGGIGGLAAAIGLKRKGFEVQVYERAPEMLEVGAGLSLWANAMTALAVLGLAEGVRAHAIGDLEGGIYNHKGRLLVSMTNKVLARRFGDYNVMIHRAELHKLLLEALGAEQVLTGKRLERFEERDGKVHAHFADGSEEEADILIGADGLRSAVRAQLHGDEKPRYSGYTAWRGVVPFERRRLLMGETWGAGARFGRIPLKDGRVYWFATQNAPEGFKSPNGEKARLLDVFRNWHQPILELIETTDEAQILHNDIYDRNPLERWGEGRVTLLGDAAHPMTPNLGQGACQALEDAVVLANRLGGSSDLSAALREYESVRRPRTASIVMQSRRMGQMGQISNPLAIRLRNTLIAAVPQGVQARGLEGALRFNP